MGQTFGAVNFFYYLCTLEKASIELLHFEYANRAVSNGGPEILDANCLSIKTDFTICTTGLF